MRAGTEARGGIADLPSPRELGLSDHLGVVGLLRVVGYGLRWQKPWMWVALTVELVAIVVLCLWVLPPSFGRPMLAAAIVVGLAAAFLPYRSRRGGRAALYVSPDGEAVFRFRALPGRRWKGDNHVKARATYDARPFRAALLAQLLPAARSHGAIIEFTAAHPTLATMYERDFLAAQAGAEHPVPLTRGHATRSGGIAMRWDPC